MKKQTGFTIVELLVVVVVIAILASITIVSFVGIQGRANDAAVQNDLKGIAGAFEIFKLNNGVYPVGDTDLSSTGIKVSKSSYGPGFSGLHNLLYCRLAASGPNEYALLAESKSGTVFTYKSSTGSITSSPAWSSTASNVNCQNAGINQISGTDRDIIKYNGNWPSWL